MGLRSFLKKKSMKKFVSRKDVQRKFNLVSTEEWPVVILGFNNGVYVQNMVEQLNRYGVRPLIIDNSSTQVKAINIFQSLARSGNAYYVRCPHNFGHEVIFMTPIYDLLPKSFFCTDPDLQFSENLPKDFLSHFSILSEKYRVFKVGMALSLTECIQEMTYELNTKRPLAVTKSYNVKEWEAQFWRFRICDEDYEIYAAPIDTTFFYCNKKYFNGDLKDGLRVAGDFSCMHLPWYPAIDIMNECDLDEYRSTKLESTGDWVK